MIPGLGGGMQQSASSTATATGAARGSNIRFGGIRKNDPMGLYLVMGGVLLVVLMMGLPRRRFRRR